VACGFPKKALILKGKARLDVHVSTRHRPHPCGLTLQNQRFFRHPAFTSQGASSIAFQFFTNLRKKDLKTLYQ